MEKDAAILVTGAAGFVGRNLVFALQNRGYTRVFAYDRDSTQSELEAWCGSARFVFHLAGVNRPKDPKEFYDGNSDLTAQLCRLLAAAGGQCPVLMTSSTRSELAVPWTCACAGSAAAASRPSVQLARKFTRFCIVLLQPVS